MAAQIDSDVALKQAGGAFGVQRLAGRDKAPLDHRLGALADQSGRDLERQGRQGFLGQQGVERPHQVRRRVHQGAVQVEGDDRAGEAALRWRCGHGGLRSKAPAVWAKSLTSATAESAR
jgi:hypothetical protein